MKATPSDAPPPPEPASENAAVPTPAPTPATAKPAVWPEWFGAVDLALAIMVLIVAFLATSFTAHNPDIWVNLATGRLLAEGKYSPGTDPFSYVGDGRAWADTSWLYSLGVYALYTADPSGAAIVAVKAVMFAVAFGLLALLRRPGHALWPWVFVGAVGIVAAAFYSPARPIVLSILFLSVTLVLLFRMPWRTESWREPGLLAGVFALWANCDAWFLLGPLTVALVLLGEKLNVFMARGEDPIATDDPFPPAPPSKCLVRALALGVAACLLNPMVLAAVAKDPGEAVAQLVPWELGFHTPADAQQDNELELMTFKPLKFFDPQPNKFLWYQADQHDETIKVNAVAYYTLLGVVLIALILGIARLRATHLVLVIAFLVLSLTHVRLIPFFTLVAAPVAAMYLNLVSKRIQLTTWGDLSTRMALGSSALGRVLCVVGALLLLGATYPGWLHPPLREKSLVNRLDWGVEPEPGLERAAKELHRLRTESGLPSDVRGLGTSLWFGDHCAWFAPGEKVFANTRYGVHRHELPDLMTVRAAMTGRRTQGSTAHDPSDIARVCETRGAGFLTVTASYRELDTLGLFQLLSSDSRWLLWHLDGRSAFVGRPMVNEQAAFAKYRYDPIRIALASDVGAIPVDPVFNPLLTPEDGWDAFLAAYLERPKTPTPDMDDSLILTGYLARLVELARLRTQQRIFSAQVGVWVASPVAVNLWTTIGAAGSIASADDLWTRYLAQHPVEDERLVIPLMTVRAARRAIAANPDRPEAYRALAIAYRQPLAPVLTTPIQYFEMSEQQLQITTAMARYIARLPAPDKSTIGQAAYSLQECLELAEMYHRTGQMDFALLMYKKALLYERSVPGEVLWATNPRTVGQPVPEGQAAKIKSETEKYLEGLSDKLERQVDITTQQVMQRAQSPAARFQEAMQFRLPALALKLFKDTPLAEFGADRDLIVIQAIVLEFRAGHLEQAANHLNDLDNDIKQLIAREPRSEKTGLFRALQEVRSRLEGNTQAAIESLNQVSLPTLDPSAKQFVSEPTVHRMVTWATEKPAAFSSLAYTAGGSLLIVNQWVLLREVLTREVTYHFDRALLDLLDGNPGAARRRFEMAAKPQGIDLGKFNDPQSGTIQRYLELLRKAEATRK